MKQAGCSSGCTLNLWHGTVYRSQGLRSFLCVHRRFERKTLGKVKEILQLPANDVYVVEGEQEYMIPAVPEFILERNPDEGFIRVRLLEGMQSDAV